MESARNMYAFEPQGSVMVDQSDEMECTKGNADLMARRLKNRERQRRYRARKRLEAEAERASSANPSVLLQAQVQSNGVPKREMSRVYCTRDWKKDARRAHASNDPESTSHDDPFTSASTLASENRIARVPYEIKADPPLDHQLHPENPLGQSDGEIRRIVLGRRDWKAEARKKKN